MVYVVSSFSRALVELFLKKLELGSGSTFWSKTGKSSTKARARLGHSSSLHSFAAVFCLFILTALTSCRLWEEILERTWDGTPKLGHISGSILRVKVGGICAVKHPQDRPSRSTQKCALASVVPVPGGPSPRTAEWRSPRRWPRFRVPCRRRP